MSDVNLSDIIESLEHRVTELLHRYETLKKANLKLTQEFATAERSLIEKDKVISDWEEKHNALKLANSMLGSSETKTEAKHKINTLIREIDYCISQISE